MCSKNTEIDDDDFIVFLDTVEKEKYNKEKRVTFDLIPQIHLMCTWKFASRKARMGEWQMMAIDRCHFMRRINSAESTLNSVLKFNHRDKIYNERFK